MRCFFNLNESAPHFWNYGEMLKVAILSLRRYTSMEPVVVYDGGDNYLSRWIVGYGVELILASAPFRSWSKAGARWWRVARRTRAKTPSCAI